MKSERSNRKIAAILIAMILAISAFPMPMAATLDESSMNFTEVQNVTNVTDKEDANENITSRNQTTNVFNATDDIATTNESSEVAGVQVKKAVKDETTLSYPFFDDMENGTGNWSYDSPWNLTDEYAHSENYSWDDSPGDFYQDSIEKSIALKIDLRTATMPVLSFWHRYSLETNKDYGYVDVSGDAGKTWSTQYIVTGHKPEWREEKIDLTGWALKEDVRIRFRIKTDAQNRYDGWYIDDVRIAETTATISYPFSDDMETVSLTEGNWLSSSWDLLLTPHAHSGTRCWTDSPEGDYINNDRSKLTLAGTIDLSTAVNPQMTFWHHYHTESCDKCYVQVSDNYGQSGTYKTLATYSGRQDNWVQKQVDLSDYAGLQNVRIRFYIWTDSSAVYDGWYIDDVRIEDAPEDVVLSVPTNVTMHGADLSWSKNTEADFATYEIYRDTSSDVTRSDTLIATITDQNTTSYKDVYSILQPNFYYYRVYVYDENGMHSLGSNVMKATYPSPPSMSYPFFDDMGSGDGNWDWGSPWGLTTKFNHSDSYSWTDSPGTSYANNANTALEMRIDLRTATIPVLSFWHRYSLETNKDYGYVDVSSDAGKTWSTQYFVTGHVTDWREEKIDLTEWALKEDVRIRFRLKTDAQNRYDGWYIDDVKMAETTATISYPFSDDMETVSLTEDNWLSSSWDLILTPHAHSGTRCWTDSPEGGMPAVKSKSKLTLAGTIDLSTAVNPQMTFWHHHELYKYGYVEVSDNYGQSGTYTKLKTYSYTQDDWVQEQVDLSDYAGLSNVRIRFRLYNYYGYSGYDGWYIDDVRIEDAPEDVALSVPTNVTMHGADLSWSKNTEADFATYEIYRDTSSYVTRSDTLIATITDQNTTSYKDVYSILQPNFYYYRVYVYDENGMHSIGSNVMKATYPSPPSMSYPFFDDMESGDGNWDWGSPWGLTTKFNHSDSYSWTDSPGTSYENNVDTALEMTIDLRTATMPVLSFWHRYSLETNKDYGYVDVSGDTGKTWKTMYFVTGHRPEWREEKIDLTGYALNEDVRIRFRIKTDGQNRYDGWYIDDVRIAETTATINYPFSNDMENVSLTEDNWLSSSWDLLLTPHAHSGTRCWTDSPEGDMPAVKSHSSLTLAGTIDLSTAVNPQMTFWHHYQLPYYGYVEISDNYGQSGTYKALKTYSRGTQGYWIQEQVDLSDYVGLSNVRIRFRLYNYHGWSGYDGWYIDDIYIGEPPDVTPPASVTNLNETDVGSTWIHINGTFKTNVSAPEHSYRATGLLPNTTYEIDTKTVDDFGNINTTWVNDTAKTLPPTGKPTVSIFTDNFEYAPGDTMNIALVFNNPTTSSVDTYFIWYLGLPDYGYWTQILVTPLTLSPSFDQSYDIPIPIGDWGENSFNATWYVALLETAAPYETISQDTADWRYVPSKMAYGETVPDEIAEEITKTVEAVELPGETAQGKTIPAGITK